MAWQDIVIEKQQAAENLVPPTYHLPKIALESLSLPLETKKNRLLELNIPKKSGLLSNRELEITEQYTTAQLLAALAKGKLSSLEVTTSFCKRAAIAQQLIKCATEVFYEDAFSRAKFLDEYLASKGRPLGPLHGLPISIKDSFKVKGYDSTIGFASLANKPAEKNSPLVDILLQLGAVLYIKTNVPQTMMTADSHNNIWGRTLNPHNTTLTAGGSTGGEGALVAFRGSPLGVGTDVAGSIRIPSLCCGIYGFKPTSARIPFGDQQSPTIKGYMPIVPAAGPMANSFTALQIFSEAVLTASPARYDSTALDIPWQALPALPSSAKLKIGVLLEDPSFPLHPPVKRAIEDAGTLLAQHGHSIVPISPDMSRISTFAELSAHFFTLDVSDTINFFTASGEPPVPSVAKPAAPIHTEALSSLRADLGKMDTFHKIAALGRVRLELTEAWRQLWNELKLDAVISPGAQNTAVKHDTYPYPAYTVFLNILDYPTCLIPCGKASKELDPHPQIYADGTKYVPEDVDQAPTAIQVFTSKMRDEACLQVGQLIDGILNPPVNLQRDS